MLQDGSIKNKLAAIALFILLLLPQRTDCQKSVLDSTFTFRTGSVKTGNALDIITKKTGYSFTYDSRLVDANKKVEMNFHDTGLRTILGRILQNDSLVYSVVDRYIIISRPRKSAPARQDSSAVSMKPGVVSGTLIDEETKEPLFFATIALKNKGKGTVSNENGEFRMNITPDLYSDTLSVSYLGYFGREIPVKQAIGNDMVIKMRREYISIPEIIIRNQIPQEIIGKARKLLPKNYGDRPAMMTGFYREGVLRKNELQTYSEAVLRIFKSPYSNTFLGDQINVFKSRKIDNANSRDTLAIRLKAGLSTCLELDGAKNIFDFISPESMNDYTYRLADIVTYADESAYAIEFEQKPSIELPLFKGTIYINTSDFGIYGAEFEINPLMINKIKESFVTSSSKGFNTWPVSVKYSVSYRKMNDRYFLNHVRGDLLFNSRQKKKLFNSQFKVFFELAITEIELNNVKRFEREELAPIHSVFSKTITSYDPLFWGDQDFLKPEENLLQALKNMKVNLQEFNQ